MIEYLWILPLGYISFFVIYTLVKSINSFTDRLVFCTTCAAYFTLLVIGLILSFPAIIWAFMLGIYISGIAHTFDEKLEEKKEEFFAQFFILHLLFTIIGLAILIAIY